MKIMKLAAYAAMAVAMFSLAACDPQVDPEGPDDPQKGDVVKANIYFSAENGDYCYYVAPGTAAEVSLKIVREEGANADSYTIKVNSSSNGMTIPEKVDFAAGSTEATIKITTPAETAALDKFDFDLSLTGDNVNTAAATDKGTIRCEGTVYVYQECTAVGSFDNGGDSFSYLGYFQQKVWKLADNKMILKNFLGSKEDFSFSYSDTWTTYGYDIPDADYTGTDYICKWDETEEGYEGAKYFYFYKAIDEENGEYQVFCPKGEQRCVDVLGLYLGNTYSCYYKTEKSDYLFFTCAGVEFYGESEGIEKSYSWLYYLYFNFVDEANLANYDCVNFPEIEASSYPEATTEVEVGEGQKKLNFSFYYGGFEMDSQAATVETVEDGTKYTVANLWQSGVACSFTMKSDGSVTVDAGDDAYLDEDDGCYWFYNLTTQKYDYFYWLSDSDYAFCISSLNLTAPGDGEYNYWEEGSAYIAVNYQFYNGSWGDAADDYIHITW